MKTHTVHFRVLSVLLAMVIMLGWLAAFPPLAYASSASELKTKIENHVHGGTSTLSATVSGDTVTVTGTVTGATNMMELNISSGVTVLWKASYTGSSINATGAMLYLSGGGTFEVALDGLIKQTAGQGYTVYASSSQAITVRISGGTVTSNSSTTTLYVNGNNSYVDVRAGLVETIGNGRAIQIGYGQYQNVSVTGGTVRACGNDSAIFVQSSSTQSVISVNGGVVESTGSGYAINTQTDSPTVYVGGGSVRATGTNGIAICTKGDNSRVNIVGGTVESTQLWAVYNEGKKGSISVTSGTVKANGLNGRAIRNGGPESKILVNGSSVIVECKDEGIALANASGGTNSTISVLNGTVRATGVNSTAIYNSGSNSRVEVSGGRVDSVYRGVYNDVPNSKIVVSGGIISGKGGPAIWNNNANSTIEVSNGFVFSLGKTPTSPGSDAVVRSANGTAIVSGVGVVCGWNKTSSTYTEGTNTDLVTNGTASVRWGRSSGQSGISYENGTNTGFFPLSDVTVNPVKYTVKFDSNGGSAVADKVVNKGDKVTKPDDPTKPGFVFAGWYKEAALTTAYNFNDAVMSNFTLYAKWTTAPKYMVTVVDGTGGGSHAAGETVYIAANPAPEGKAFDRWTTSDGVSFANATNASTSFTMPSKAVTVTATYKDLPAGFHTVNVTADGGGTANADVPYAKQGDTVTLTAEAAEGYSFKSWQVISGGVTISDDKFVMPNRPVTIKAIFQDDSVPEEIAETPDPTDPDATTPDGEPVAPDEVTATPVKKSLNWRLILLISLGVLTLGCLLAFLLVMKKEKKKDKEDEPVDAALPPQDKNVPEMKKD